MSTSRTSPSRDGANVVSVSASDTINGVSASARSDFSATSAPYIYSTAEWDARPALRTHFTENWAEGIVIHHTEYPNRQPESDPEREKELAFIGHMDVHSTSCPGQIMNHLDRLKSGVREIRKQLA